MKKSGGKRAGAGRKAKEEKTLTISFRVFSFAEPQIKEYIKKLSVKERTKLLLSVCSDSV
jgi:hypothetical protein